MPEKRRSIKAGWPRNQTTQNLLLKAESDFAVSLSHVSGVSVGFFPSDRPTHYRQAPDDSSSNVMTNSGKSHIGPITTQKSACVYQRLGAKAQSARTIGSVSESELTAAWQSAEKRSSLSARQTEKRPLGRPAAMDRAKIRILRFKKLPPFRHYPGLQDHD